MNNIMSPLRPTPAQRALDVEKRRARNLKKKRSRQSHPLPNPFGLPPPFYAPRRLCRGALEEKGVHKTSPVLHESPTSAQRTWGIWRNGGLPYRERSGNRKSLSALFQRRPLGFYRNGDGKRVAGTLESEAGGDSPRLFYGRMKRRISGADRKCGFLRFSTGYRGHQHTLCPLYVGNGYPHRPSSAV